ncbi:ATP-binding protein [Bradyrhizobium erythrophlei]|uniref:sensor histidine kinase n=1 Tax=Bradyrhizobium erythrophlei TaxID=1437360 RepID=UPI0035E90D17
MSELSGRRLVRWTFIALCVAFQVASGTIALADEPVPILKDGETDLRFHVRAIIENGTPLDPETVAKNSASALPHPISPPNFGRSSQPAWGYVTVVNRLNRREWVLRYALPTVEDVRVFVRPAGAQDFQQIHELGENARWPFSGYRVATYLISLNPDVPVEIVTRLHTRVPIGFPLTISSTINFFEMDRDLIASAATLGAVPLTVLVYVAMLAGVLRHRGLVSLMVMLLSKLILDAWITGFGQLVLPFVARGAWPTIGFTMVGIFQLSCIMHIRRYLDLSRAAPHIDTLLLATAAILTGLVASELTGLYNARFLLQLISPLVFAVFVAISVRAAWREPSLGSVCYALAWSFFLSEAAMFLLRLLALVPFSAPTLTFSQSAVASLLFGVAIFRRIKDQDQALNRSLAESNERFRLAIDGSAAAIYEYVQPNNTFFYAPRLAELLAVPDGSSLPRLLARLSRSARKQIFDSLREALAGRARSFRAEVVHAASDGPPRYLAVTGAIQYGGSGAFRRICGSVIDVTSEHALAVEQKLGLALVQEKERAERSLAARTIFYAAANHDLRHPLLSLGLYLQMLAKDRTLKKLNSFLPRMLEAHRSAIGYLDVILDLARTDTGSVTPSPAMQPLQPIFSKLVDQYHADAAHAALSLRFVATSSVVLTDTFLLDRILSNLLSNAIRSTKKGGVLLGCRRLRDGIRIDVVDTGPGLPREVYQRVTSARLSGAVVGESGAVQLGLFIVQRMAEELGCAIDIATRPGKGTRFSIIIR